MPQTRLHRSQLDNRIRSVVAAAYALQLSDSNAVVRMANTGANSVTVPPASSVGFLPGCMIEIIQWGPGQTTLVAGSGVTLNSPDGLVLAGQGASVTLIYVGGDEWDVVILGVIGTPPPTYAETVLSDSPLAYYKLNETSGPTMVDSSGNGYNGTFSSVSYGQSELVVGAGSSIRFNQQASKGEVTSVAAFDAIVAVEAWASLLGTTKNASRVFASRDSLGTSSSRWILGLNNGSNSPWRLESNRDGSGSACSSAPPPTFVTGAPYHFVWQFEPGDGLMHLYINGAEANYAVQSAVNIFSSGSGKNLKIGHLNYTTSVDFSPEADLSNVAFYTTPLTPARVAEHYAVGAGL